VCHLIELNLARTMQRKTLILPQFLSPQNPQSYASVRAYWHALPLPSARRLSCRGQSPRATRSRLTIVSRLLATKSRFTSTLDAQSHHFSLKPRLCTTSKSTPINAHTVSFECSSASLLPILGCKGIFPDQNVHASCCARFVSRAFVFDAELCGQCDNWLDLISYLRLHSITLLCHAQLRTPHASSKPNAAEVLAIPLLK